MWIFLLLAICSAKTLRDVSYTLDDILQKFDEGAIEKAKSDNHFAFYLKWQTKDSRLEECRRCGYEKYLYDFPDYKIDKEETIVLLMKRLTEAYPDMDLALTRNTCCYKYSMEW